MIIGVDFDNVLADYTNTFGKLYKKLKGITTELPEVLDWDFGSWSITREEFNTYHKLFIKNNWTEQMPVMKNALEVLHNWHSDGHTIKIITHRASCSKYRPELRAEIIADTAHWLHHNMVPFEELCFVKEKTQVYTDVMIDDSPKVLQQYIDSGKEYIVYSYAYNKDLPGKRARNWKEIQTIIQQILQHPTPKCLEENLVGSN